jgi:hypothetical protein
MEADKVKQEILPLVHASGIEDGTRQDLCDNIENFLCDRKERHRLIHDEWYVSLVEQPPKAMVRTRGLPRERGAEVVFGGAMPEDIWNLARRFREYRSVFSVAFCVLRQYRGLASETVHSSDDRP